MPPEVVLGIKEEGADATAKKIKALEDALEDLRAEVKRLKGPEIDTDPAEQELKELRAELRRLDKRFLSAEDRVKKYQQRLKTAEKGSKEFANDTRNLRRALKDVSDTGRQLEGVIKKLPPEFRKAARSLDDVRKRADQARASLNKLGSTKSNVSALVSSIGQLRTGVGALVAVLGVRQILRFGEAILRIGGQAVEARLKFASLIPALTEFTGSTELAEEVADKLGGTADRLQTPLADLIQPFLRISAATKETNLTLAEQSDLFESALLTVKAFGLGAEETSRLITGFSQVAGKGTLQMEELRQQIGEVAFNALPALSKALGISLPDLFAQVSAGAIDAETALRGLATGLREANEAAGLAQLDTLRGDLGAFSREAEKAQLALAEGLEPGLRAVVQAATEFLETNRSLIAGLGELGNSALKELGRLVELSKNVGLALKSIGLEALELGRLLEDISKANPILSLLLSDTAELVTELGVAIGSTKGEVKVFVDDATKAYRKLLGASGETAEEILEAFKNTFRESAEAAGLSAEDIEATVKELADRVGDIQDQSIDDRIANEKKLVDDIREFGEIRVETEDEVAATIVANEKKAIEDRAALQVTLLEETRRNGEARIEAEKVAAAEIETSIQGLLETASQVADERILIERNVTDELVSINLETEEKKNDIIREFGIKAATATAEERLKLEEDLVNDLVDLFRKNAEEFQKAEERIQKAAEASANKRIETEKKVQEELKKSLKIQEEIFEALDKIASETEEGDQEGPLANLVDQAQDFILSLDQINAKLKETLGSDVGVGFKDLDNVLGQTSASFDFLGESVTAAGEQIDQSSKLSEQLGEALEGIGATFKDLDSTSQQTLGLILERFQEIVDNGAVTQETISEFKSEIEELRDNAAPAASETADAIGEIGDKAQDLDKVKDAAGGIQEGLEGAGEEAKTTGESFIQLADGSLKFIESAGQVAEKSIEASEGIKQLGAPIEVVATSSERLAVALPTVSEALTILQPQVAAILATLAESEVNLPELAAQLERLSESLPVIGTALAAIQTVTATLPDEVTLLQEALAPLLEVVAQAAEGDHFAILAAALERIAEVLPDIPEPLEGFRDLLSEIVDQQGEFQEAFEAIATGLENIGSEEIRANLSTVTETMEDLLAVIEDTSGAVEELNDATSELNGLLPVTDEEFRELASTLEGQVVPALMSTTTAAGASADALDDGKTAAKQFGEAGTKAGDDTAAAMQRATRSVHAFIEAMDAAIVKAGELAAATAAVQLGG